MSVQRQIEMVVQKSWSDIEASSSSSQQSSTSAPSSTTTWSFQAPVKVISVRSTTTTNAPQIQKPTVTRQIAINTLAAMHRRFSLPGPVQPHSRPIAEFRASANKSLDMLRQTVQSAVSKEIDQVIKKYLEKFFVPAVNNIRLNLGDESVSEDQVRAVCRAMLDATRLLYTTPPKPAASTAGDAESGTVTESKLLSAAQITLPSQSNKRKESESEADINAKRVKIKQEDIDSGASSPMPSPPIRDPDKWNPERLTLDTLFIMGSHAHKVLGLGNARGRLYTRHSGLLRYPADSSDKEWIAGHNLVNAVGGKTYIMVLADIEELAKSEAYRHTSLPMLGELTGFKVPPFMLRKIKTYVTKRCQGGDLTNQLISEPVIVQNPQPGPSIINVEEEDQFKLEDIKIERRDDFDSENFNASQYNVSASDDNRDFPEVPDLKEDADFADIPIKVEDIDDIKVDDLDVDVKVESIDDINVDGIKVEDIKLEADDFDLCKSEDEQNNLVDGLLDADIEFLSRNLGDIESDLDARKTIEKLTGANPDTITLVGDEFDLEPTLNTGNFSSPQTTKCITVVSTTSGMVHSVPVAHIATSPRITGSTVHYYTSSNVQPTTRTIHHMPSTVTIQNIPGSTSQMIQRIPMTNKSGSFSTVMSQGTASAIIGFGTRPSNASASATILSAPQYINVTSKSFPTGNILHNAIVSRNIINRSLPVTSAVTFNVTTVRPLAHTTTPAISTVSTASEFDNMTTAKDMIDNACNSSVMLKKVLTLGSAAASKSFIMHNTQKVLSTGFANGSAPPNVTIVSSGTSGGGLTKIGTTTILSPTSGTLSATHATLSALLASSENSQPIKK